MRAAHSRPITLPILLLAVAAAAPAPSHAGEPHGLATGTLRSAGTPTGVVLGLDQSTLGDLRRGRVAELSVPLPGAEETFVAIRTRRREGTSTWRGRSPAGDATILLTVGVDHLFGRVVQGDRVLLLEPGDAPFEVVRRERDPAREWTAACEVEPVRAPAPDPENGADRAGTVSERRALAPAAVARGDDGSRIDVMVLYTDGMAAEHPGTQIDTRIQHLIDLTNAAYDASLVPTELRLVHSAQVTYPDDSPGGMGEALDDFRDNVGVFSTVEADRTTYGADQATLLRRFVDEGCGRATVITSNTPRSAYALVHDGERPDHFFCSDYTYAHEIGHNHGCAHDRANAGVFGRFEDSFGYQDPLGFFRTIMAYSTGCPSSCPQIGHFSNPDVSSSGRPTGIAAPAADSADNARTIEISRVEMAGFRATVSIEEIFADGFESGDLAAWGS